MDGLLVDSEPLWTIAEQRVAERLGGAFTPELKARMIGKRIDLAVGILLEGLGTPAAGAGDPDEIGRMLMSETASLFAAGVPLQPGADGAAGRAAGSADVPLALVSSSYRELVDAALRSVGAHRFAVTIAGDEVAHGKPSPEPYLAAAKALQVVPARCVVLEDAPVRAGERARGRLRLRLRADVSAGRARSATCRSRVAVRASLREVDLALLGQLSVHPESLGRAVRRWTCPEGSTIWAIWRLMLAKLRRIDPASSAVHKSWARLCSGSASRRARGPSRRAPRLRSCRRPSARVASTWVSKGGSASGASSRRSVKTPSSASPAVQLMISSRPATSRRLTMSLVASGNGKCAARPGRGRSA